MKLPISIAEKLVLIQNGEKIPFSTLKHPTILSMIENGVLKTIIAGRSKTQICISNKDSLSAYLKNHFGIDNLKRYIEVSQKEDLTRAEAIDISSNSKLKSIRTFKGFLVNSYEPIECKLNNKTISIYPQDGIFVFIYDYENFIPSDKITIVGIENPENFRHIQKFKKLFADIQPLFVCRYPQNKDLIKWLQKIPNNYIHFGDFDYAGLNIYYNEYKKHLKLKAQFFIPSDIEKLLSTKGNRDNYSNQTIQFKIEEIEEEPIKLLILLIEKYKKGLEQEILNR